MPNRILVSNDDGIYAPGLAALVEAVSPLGEVWVVAPENEQSASSHALSIHRPLRIKPYGERRFSVDGTPADCSYLAVNHILKDEKPVLMVSGINHGANLADDVTYSGTVAAAMEASLLGIPAIAFSLASPAPHDFTHAKKFIHGLVKTVLGAKLPPGRMLLNVNFPAGAPTGFQVTKLGKHTYGYDVVESTDPRGRKYYWIGGSDFRHQDIPGSDCSAVLTDRRVSITPLHLDLTEYRQLDFVGGLKVDGFEKLETPNS